MKVITRFAPSPSGFLHLGNLRTALFNYLLARKHNGEFLLRIEDTDMMRSNREYCSAIKHDLEQFGLEFDREETHQSARINIYRREVAKLLDMNLAYRCYCDRETLEKERKLALKAGKAPRYSGKCALLPSDRQQDMPFSVRFRVPEGKIIHFSDLVKGEQKFSSSDIGDFIILRPDGYPSFIFANIVDDLDAEITHILRGEDHLSNTPKQIMIAEALGKIPPLYGHLPLIVNSSGKPLSKRDGDFSVKSLLAAGFLPQALINYMARLGHYYGDNEAVDLPTLTRRFEFERLGKSAAKYDHAQLETYQAAVLPNLTIREFRRWAAKELTTVPPEKLPDFIAMIQANISNLAEVASWAKIMTDDSFNRNPEMFDPKLYPTAILAARNKYSYEKFITHLNKSGFKGKNLFMPLRMSLTGRTDGPALGDIYNYLGHTEVIARLEKAQQLYSA